MKRKKKQKVDIKKLMDSLGLGKEKYCFKCGRELVDGGTWEKSYYNSCTGEKYKFRVEKCPKYGLFFSGFGHTENRYMI